MSATEKVLAQRRSIYQLTKKMPIDDKRLQELLGLAVREVPSAFNMQSQRVVLLLAEQNKKLWNIVLDTLRPMVAPQNFGRTEQKIASFAAGYGTVLYFDDTATTEEYASKNAEFKDNFPTWAQQANGMLQYTVWTLLAENGVGASLQHYNPLIDEAVQTTWKLPAAWKLIAQMPFGGIGAPAGEKDYLPLEERLRIFK